MRGEGRRAGQEGRGTRVYPCTLASLTGHEKAGTGNLTVPEFVLVCVARDEEVGWGRGITDVTFPFSFSPQ